MVNVLWGWLSSRNVNSVPQYIKDNEYDNAISSLVLRVLRVVKEVGATIIDKESMNCILSKSSSTTKNESNISF